MTTDLTAVRDELVSRHHLTTDDAELLLTGTDKPTLQRQAERLEELRSQARHR